MQLAVSRPPWLQHEQRRTKFLLPMLHGWQARHLYRGPPRWKSNRVTACQCATKRVHWLPQKPQQRRPHSWALTLFRRTPTLMTMWLWCKAKCWTLVRATPSGLTCSVTAVPLMLTRLAQSCKVVQPQVWARVFMPTSCNRAEECSLALILALPRATTARTFRSKTLTRFLALVQPLWQRCFQRQNCARGHHFLTHAN